ncbi:MAG: hypothetical protein ACKPAH_12665, partial [Verrucomicrobiota bacterium]
LSLREALCHLRRGELANCLSNHNADSCLMPLRGGGIYRTRDDSLMARRIHASCIATTATAPSPTCRGSTASTWWPS